MLSFGFKLYFDPRNCRLSIFLRDFAQMNTVCPNRLQFRNAAVSMTNEYQGDVSGGERHMRPAACKTGSETQEKRT